jgi:hypothetical protein
VKGGPWARQTLAAPVAESHVRLSRVGRVATVTSVRVAPGISIVLAACSSSGAGASAGADASIRYDAGASDAALPEGGAAEASVSDSGASCAIDVPGGLIDLVGRVVSAMRSGAPVGSNALAIPPAATTAAFAAQVVQILGGNEGAACALPSSYRLVRLDDPSAGTLRVVVETDGTGLPSPSLFWGTYAAPVVAPSPARDLVVEAPHPIFDTNTEVQSAAVFLASGARLLATAAPTPRRARARARPTRAARPRPTASPTPPTPTRCRSSPFTPSCRRPSRARSCSCTATPRRAPRRWSATARGRGATRVPRRLWRARCSRGA